MSLEARGPPVTGSAGTAARLVAESIGGRRGGVHAFRQSPSGTAAIRIGRRDASGTALGPSDAFRVGSLSKLIVATLVLTLRDGGDPLLDLDAPLATYLGTDSVGARATIRGLLSHRSGLPGYTEHPGFEHATLDDRDRCWKPREVLGTFIEGRPQGEALAAVQSYSNTNFLLLGLAIERVTARPLHEVIRDELVARPALTRTVLPHAGWNRPDWLVPAWSPGTLRGGPRDPYTSFESAAWAAGAVVSSAADLASIIDALFDDQFLDPGRRREMITPSLGDHGFGVRTMQLGRRRWLGHLGIIRGYMSAIRFDRRGEQKVIVLERRPHQRRRADQPAGHARSASHGGLVPVTGRATARLGTSGPIAAASPARATTPDLHAVSTPRRTRSVTVVA